jgi:hypothetical protein
MSLRFAVVHEAEADFNTATELADRVLVDAIEWLEEMHLDSQREWLANSSGGQRLTWKAVKQLARDAGIRAHGHFDGAPGLPDAVAARRAILFLRREFPNLNAIVLIRDQDDQPERGQGLEQAKDETHGGMTIVIGLAIVERECWVISGFECDDGEIALLEEIRKELGFDPRHHSHELTACKNNQALRSPKRVLQHLTQGNYDRERRCWTETSLLTLMQRGGGNGLTPYLNCVYQRLASLIGHIG